jgi:hypothetical protein
MKTDSFCTESLRVEFQRAGVNVAPSYDLALHTGEPEGDDQRSKEVSLAGYARLAVMRDSVTWSVRGRKVINAVVFVFPTITSGKVKATHLSIGISGKIRRLVKLSEPIDLKANYRVEFDPGHIEIEESTHE